MVPRNTKDSLKLVRLLGYNDINLTSLIIQNDTVFFLVPSREDKNKHEFIRSFRYNPINKQFYFTTMVQAYPGQNIVNRISNNPQVYLKSLGNTGIKYRSLPDQLRNNTQVDSINKEDLKIQTYDKNYYMIITDGPKELFVYNVLNNELKKFPIASLILRVTDFFLFDLDKDGRPEVFIFDNRILPREEIMSYLVFSFRTDTVKVNNE